MATLRPTSEWGSAGWGAIPWGGNFPAGTGDQTVGPVAATSRRSVSSVFITPPGIGPAAAVSRRHIPGPVALVGGTITLSMGHATSRRALGSVNIAGPISPAAAVSRRNVGIPFINAIQTLDITAAASRRSASNVRVDIVESIAPAHAVSRRATGSVTMTGGPHAILIYPAVSRRQAGMVKITGGGTDLVVSVGGVVWPGRIGFNSPDGVMILGATDTAAPVTYASGSPPTITSQTLGRWVLQIDLGDDSGLYSPALGQTIVVTEGGYLRFAGCIQTVATERFMGTLKTLIFHVTATDKSAICDRRLVPTQVFPVGTDLGTVIATIVSTCLNGEGILTTATSVPQNGSLGVLASVLNFNYDTVTNAFNTIGTLGGLIWFVDPTGLLTFTPFSSLAPAPFMLEDDPPTQSKNFRGLLVTQTNIDYANKIYAVSNLTVLPGSTGGGSGSGTGQNTETYIMTPGNIGVDVLPDGTTVYGVDVTLPIGTLYSITVNGFTQTVVEITQWAGQEPNFGTNDFGPWFWTSNTSRVTLSVLSGAAFPITGATLIINYTPYTQNSQAQVGEALTPIDPATGDPLGTCGSGIYELAVQVQNVSDVNSLNAIAAAELLKRQGVPVRITFQTDKQGLAPGQLLTVNVPAQFLNNAGFLITYLQGVAAPVPLEFGSRFQWEVQGQSNEDPGNWFQWYANLLANASNPLPVPAYETADFVLAPGSSLAGGNLATNPYQVKHTGKLFSIYAAAELPPTNQDLVIFFFVNGNRIPGQIVIPGGSTPNQSFVFPFDPTNPQYVFNTATEADVITIGVQYNVFGGSPTPASNVSATLQWTF